MAKAPTSVNPFEQNAIARNLIRQRGVEMVQTIYNQTLVGNPMGQVVNIQPRNAGLIKKFIVRVSFTLAQAAAETFNRSFYGPQNILSNVTLTDYSNNTRINTTGFHLTSVATVKAGGAFGAAFTSDNPLGYGAGYNSIIAPASITTAQTVQMYYEIPCCYSDSDLTGAIPGMTNNATMQLQLQVSPQLVVPTGANQTLAVYRSTTASLGNITNFQIEVSQVYIDQLPQASDGQYILPVLDVTTMYQMVWTNQAGLVAGQDAQLAYANARQFLSTVLIYDNAGSLNGGTDISRFRLQSANALDIFQMTPQLVSNITRKMIGNDMPIGSYYFSHRERPINTDTFGNMSLLVTPSLVNGASAVLLVGYEFFARTGQIMSAASIQS